MAGRLQVEVLAPGDAELWAFLEACPTSFAQQTPAWREVVAGLGEDEPMFLGCRRGELLGVLPAYRFQGPRGAILTSAAQAGPLGGVACRAGVERDSVYQALLAGFRELSASQGCALATVISNPLWPDRELYERYLEPDYVLENTCQVLDLERALDPDGQPLAASRHLRRNLRKAHSGPLRIDERQDPALVAEWYALHAARHRTIGATPLPEDLFRGTLAHMVPRDKARFFFVRLADGGDLVAGGLYLYHGAVMDALMPSFRTEYASLAPNYLLALHSMRWARARGLRYYNFQASPPGSGVYRFKSQWGARDASYCYLTAVTGDVAPFLGATVAEIRSSYRWHFVLPYDQIAAPAAGRPRASSRQAAWAAAERSEP